MTARRSTFYRSSRCSPGILQDPLLTSHEAIYTYNIGRSRSRSAVAVAAPFFSPLDIAAVESTVDGNEDAPRRFPCRSLATLMWRGNGSLARAAVEDPSWRQELAGRPASLTVFPLPFPSDRFLSFRTTAFRANASRRPSSLGRFVAPCGYSTYIRRDEGREIRQGIRG